MDRVTAQDLVLNVLKNDPALHARPSEVHHLLEGKVNRQYVYDILHMLLKKGAVKRENGRYSYVQDPIKGKTIKLTSAQVSIARKLGIPVETYAKELVKASRKPRKPRQKKIDWEKLAKDLQKALRDEIVENQARATDIETLLFKVRSLEHQVIGFQAVISYLETKSGNDSI